MSGILTEERGRRESRLFLCELCHVGRAVKGVENVDRESTVRRTLQLECGDVSEDSVGSMVGRTWRLDTPRTSLHSCSINSSLKGGRMHKR